MSNPNIPEAQLPAFPFACQGPTTGPEFYYGITIRDYFAAKALQGWLASFGPETTIESTEHEKIIAAFAYRISDAMIAERSK